MECPNCETGKMEIFEETYSKIVWKCCRCGYEEETIRPAFYNNWEVNNE